MTLEDAKKFGQLEANRYNTEIAIIDDKFSEEETPYTYCATAMMYILYPEHHKEYWNLIEVLKPKNKMNVVYSRD